MKKIIIVAASIISIIVVLIGIFVVISYRKKIEESKYTKIGLYFYDKSAQNFVRVERKVLKSENLYKTAVEELIKGPEDKNTLAVFPKNVRIKELYISHFDTAVVNFSKNLLDYGGGHTIEIGIVGSLVLTLTDFKEIKCVQILIDSKRYNYLPEGIEILNPIYRKDWEKLVVKK